MKMDTLQLRQATADDARILVAVLHDAFEEYQGRLDPPSGVHAETVETVRHKLSTGYAVLALVDDEVAGCVFYQPQQTYLYLGRLSVLPHHRRRGVDRALIDYVEHQAVRLNLPRVQVGVRVVLPELRALL
jgi:predicted N-acetyltransferase YhbS